MLITDRTPRKITSEVLGFVVIRRLSGAETVDAAVAVMGEFWYQPGFSMWNQGEPKMNEW
jgi:hypothetical protein